MLKLNSLMKRNQMLHQRKRVAAQELAEADKIKIVTAAEAEAEKDRLHGVGIAQQRKAIVDGLAESIAELKEANVVCLKSRLCLFF